MAALGHAVIIWPGMGVIAPLVIWATQRKKSRFVAFQAVQAAVYHMTLILGGVLCGVCYLFSYFGMMVASMVIPLSMFFGLPQSGPPPDELPREVLIPILLGFLGTMLFYVVIFGLLFLGLAVWAAYIGYGLYAAVANLQGKDFRYVVIGPRLERYLRQA